jgi:hypothetical protein
MKKFAAICSGMTVLFFLTGCAGQGSGETVSSPPAPASTGYPSASPSEAPEVPGLPEVRDVPDVPEVPEVPDVPDEPDVSAEPEASNPDEPEAIGQTTASALDPGVTPMPVETAECDGDSLGISIAAQPMASGAGSFFSEITFENISGNTCFMEGPPSIFALADSVTGAVAGQRGADSGVPETVQLAPGASAYSTIRFGNAGAYDCDTAVADVAKVSPPNYDSSRSIALESPVTVCTTPATYTVSWVSATSLL